MRKPFTLHEENMAEVMLVQALCGAITPNFRMIALSLDPPDLVVRFVLEAENSEDREEIEDIVGEFSALLGHFPRRDIHLRGETTVTKDWLEPPNLPTRIVYKRKESLSAQSAAAVKDLSG